MYMAYAIYIDETYDSKSKYIVMAGFIIPLNRWNITNQGIINLKAKYFSNYLINLKSIRRKNYDKSGVHETWEKLEPKQKEEFNEEFYNLVCNENNCFICSLIDKEKMEKKGKERFFWLAYSFILQRYEYFLSEKKSCGIVIMDIAETSQEIKNLYSSHKECLSLGLPVQRRDMVLKVGNTETKLKDYERMPLKHICENLSFQQDNDNNMLQIVDMLAYGISGKYNFNQDRWFKKIEKIIRKNSNGKMEGYGIKIFPSQN